MAVKLPLPISAGKKESPGRRASLHLTPPTAVQLAKSASPARPRVRASRPFPPLVGPRQEGKGFPEAERTSVFLAELLPPPIFLSARDDFRGGGGGGAELHHHHGPEDEEATGRERGAESGAEAALATRRRPSLGLKMNGSRTSVRGS